LTAAFLALPSVLFAAPEEAASNSSFELVSVARFGERAVAVIGLESGSRKVVKLGEDVGRTGYVLSEVDVGYVELTRGGEVVTLTIDNADAESIARRKAARDAKEAAVAVKKENDKAEKKKPKKSISEALILLKKKLGMKIEGEWKLENASAADIAAAIRKWTTGEDGESVPVRVLRHPNADNVSVTASGTGTTVVDALNMMSKEFSVPYTATHDGQLVIGSGYFFRKQQFGINDTMDDVAERYQADPGVLRGLNPPDPKQGSYLIVPVPVNP
jgi:hypothetical protein